MYKDVVSELAGGDLERLPEVKCLSCLCAHCAEIKTHLLMFTLFGSLHIMAVENVLEKLAASVSRFIHVNERRY
jgi:hypothetical protein